MAQFGATARLVGVVGQVVKVEAWCSLNTQASVNGSYWRVQAAVGGSLTLGQLLTNRAPAVANVYISLMAAAAVHNGIGARVYPANSPDLGSPAAYDNGQAGAGAHGADPLPSQVCGLVKLGTDTRGRGGRGRVFTPFPDKSASAAGVEAPTAAYRVILDTLGTLLSSPWIVTVGLVTLTLLPVIYKRSSGATRDVTTGVGSPKWGTQRRRGDFGRFNASPV